jgi:hypothetical protein
MSVYSTSTLVDDEIELLEHEAALSQADETASRSARVLPSFVVHDQICSTLLAWTIIVNPISKIAIRTLFI